jgi:hypothetical protein
LGRKIAADAAEKPNPFFRARYRAVDAIIKHKSCELASGSGFETAPSAAYPKRTKLKPYVLASIFFYPTYSQVPDGGFGQ